MELVLISPETERPDEAGILTEYCAAGLARYHVRKPGWSAARLAAWIEAVPPSWRSRLVLHSHHELVEQYGLLGRHWPDAEVSGWSATSGRAGPDRASRPAEARPEDALDQVTLRPGTYGSCSCHRLEDLIARSGKFDSVFFGPVFVSPSKPDRPALSRSDLAAVSRYLTARSPAQRRTKVIALSGITPERVGACRALGFDGVATISGVYGPEPRVTRESHEISNGLGVVERDLRARWLESGVTFGPLVGSARPEVALHHVTLPERARAVGLRPTPLHQFAGHLMCLTQEGEALDHVAQATELCAAGAKLIQLRVKGAALPRWTEIARAVTRICHDHGARCLINDRPDVAIAVGADGAHVGQNDGDWPAARRLLGPNRLLGGTVNDVAGARRAVAAGGLDYVGVGPFRFTTTKQKLAPILGVEGVREVIAALDGLPAWVIGGIQAADLPAVAATGAAGVAVSSYLYRGASIAERFRALASAWPDASAELQEPSLSVS